MDEPKEEEEVSSPPYDAELMLIMEEVRSRREEKRLTKSIQTATQRLEDWLEEDEEEESEEGIETLVLCVGVTHYAHWISPASSEQQKGSLPIPPHDDEGKGTSSTASSNSDDKAFLKRKRRDFQSKLRKFVYASPAEGDTTTHTWSEAEEEVTATGRATKEWTSEEKRIFVETLEKYGRHWQAIAELVGTKTINQIRDYYYDYKKQVEKYRANKIKNKQDGGALMKNTCIIHDKIDDRTHYFSAEEEPLPSVLNQVGIDPDSIRAIAITHDFQLMIEENPEGMEKILEAIVETFPNLGNILLVMQEDIPDDDLCSRFADMLSQHIFTPFVGRSPFALVLRSFGRVSACSIDQEHDFGLFCTSNPGNSALLRPLVLRLLKLPNLYEFAGFRCPREWMEIICSHSNLRELDLNDKDPWGWDVGFEDSFHSCFHLLIAALSGANNRKRKRTQNENQAVQEGGGLCKLETLILHDLGKTTLVNDNVVKSLCEAMKKNTTVRLFRINGLWNDSWGSSRWWEELLDLLRHNGTLEDLDVIIIPVRDFQDNPTLAKEIQYSPCVKEQLLSILTQSNHVISCILFGCVYHGPTEDVDRIYTQWIHPPDIQQLLNLNYYQLSHFALAKNKDSPLQMVGFPKALVSAFEKEEESTDEEDTDNEDSTDNGSTDEETHRLLSCLFQIWVENPTLLINAGETYPMLLS